MGEFSKTIGDKGEKIVDEFLDLLGWKSKPINETMPCEYPKKHKNNSSKKGKSTHGSDSFFIYRSPFFTGQLDHIIISSKFSDGEYGTSLPSTFKAHFKDLSYTVECYQKSSLRIQNNEVFQDIENEKISGILFWLSNNETHFKTSIIDKFNPNSDKELIYDTNYLIDSARASFLYDAIRNTRVNYLEYEFEFYYIDTGNNPSDSQKRYLGNKLPIQLIISDIQIFRLQKGDEIIVALIVKDSFSKDSLNRILGLAHNIAKGLVTKINIHFPDYKSEKHDSDITRIKQGFESSNLVDSINILSYNDTVTSLGNKNKDRKLPKLENRIDQIKLNHKQILPYGNDLRDLLSRSQITTSEMNRLLRRKGVYLADPTKENIVPILSCILLSPDEFDYLKEKQNTNEDKEKRVSNLPIKCNELIKSDNLINWLDNINLVDIRKDDFPNYKFHIATLNFERVGNDPDHVRGSYRITKTENNKIWFDNRNEFTGKISLKLNKSDLEIVTTSSHTSKETRNMNRWINQSIIRSFKEKEIINKATQEQQILMGEMSNQEIMKFLLSLTSNIATDELTFESIISMDIELDKEKHLPSTNKLKWMEDKIRRFKFDGEKIEGIELITDNSNHEYLKCWGMVAEYKLDSIEGKGDCIISFSFQKNNQHEFEFHIDKLKLDKIISTKKTAENFILDSIDNLKLEKYKTILDNRN
jgi:hypothetical protein